MEGRMRSHSCVLRFGWFFVLLHERKRATTGLLLAKSRPSLTTQSLPSHIICLFLGTLSLPSIFRTRFLFCFIYHSVGFGIVMNLGSKR